MRVFCASPADLELDWPRFLPFLVRFERCTHEMSAGQIMQAIKDERQQLWGLQDERDVRAVCLTEILEQPKGRVCLIVGACGSASRPWMHALLEQVKLWARAIGCVKLRICGRRGWLRVFREFSPVGVILEAPL